MRFQVKVSVGQLKFECLFESEISRYHPYRDDRCKWDYIRLPDGEYRHWPESVRRDGYHIYASRNSVLIYRENPPPLVYCGCVYRTDQFEIRNSADAPEYIRHIALELYDSMVLGTLGQHRQENYVESGEEREADNAAR